MAHRLAQLHEAALSKKMQKQKQKQQKSITTVRRSSRLQSKVGATKNKESLFIDSSTPEKVATRLDFEASPPHDEVTPPREESPFQQEHEIEFEREPSPKRSPEIDPDQQRVYNYLETLEQVAAGPSTVLPLEQQVHSLKQEIFELEVLNRHIIQENEKLKEQANIDKMVHNNTMLHLGIWQKKNRKLKKKCRKLSRALVNIKFRCLVRKPRVNVATQRKRRRLDVLAEASQQVD